MYGSSLSVELIAPRLAAGDGAGAGVGGIDYECQNADYEKIRGAWRRSVVRGAAP